MPSSKQSENATNKLLELLRAKEREEHREATGKSLKELTEDNSSSESSAEESKSSRPKEDRDKPIMDYLFADLDVEDEPEDQESEGVEVEKIPDTDAPVEETATSESSEEPSEEPDIPADNLDDLLSDESDEGEATPEDADSEEIAEEESEDSPDDDLDLFTLDDEDDTPPSEKEAEEGKENQELDFELPPDMEDEDNKEEAETERGVNFDSIVEERYTESADQIERKKQIEDIETKLPGTTSSSELDVPVDESVEESASEPVDQELRAESEPQDVASREDADAEPQPETTEKEDMQFDPLEDTSTPIEESTEAAAVEEPTEEDISDTPETVESDTGTAVEEPEADPIKYQEEALEEEEPIGDEMDEMDSDEPLTFVYQKERKFSPRAILLKLGAGRSRIGLDLGSYSIKFIVANEVTGEITIENYGYTKIPEPIRGNQEKVREFTKTTLKEILGQREIKKPHLHMVLTGSALGIKNIQMPKVSKKELKEAVRWATRKHLSFSADESVMDYKVLRETTVDGAPKLDILVIAALNTLIDENIDLLSKEKIPHKIIPNPLATWSYFKKIYPTEEAVNVMFCNVGHESTMITVIHKGELRFAREVGVAGKDFTQALVGNLITKAGARVNVEWELAETLKHKYGLPAEEHEHRLSDEEIPLEQISSRLRGPAEKLGNEIQRSMQYFNKEFSYGTIDKIYLTGGTASLMNLENFLQDYLNIDLDVCEPLKNINLGKQILDLDQLENNARALVIPTGVSLDTDSELNLLPEKLAQETQNVLLRSLFRVCLVVTLGVSLTLSSMTAMKSKDYEKRLSTYQEQIQQLSPLQKEYLALKDNQKEARQHLTALRRMHNEPTLNAQILKILSNLIPEHITLSKLIITDPKTNPVQANVTFGGVIKTSPYDRNVRLAEFIMHLENSGYMKKANLQTNRPFDSKEFTGMYFEIQTTIANSNR